MEASNPPLLGGHWLGQFEGLSVFPISEELSSSLSFIAYKPLRNFEMELVPLLGGNGLTHVFA